MARFGGIGDVNKRHCETGLNDKRGSIQCELKVAMRKPPASGSSQGEYRASRQDHDGSDLGTRTG